MFESVCWSYKWDDRSDVLVVIMVNFAMFFEWLIFAKCLMCRCDNADDVSSKMKCWIVKLFSQLSKVIERFIPKALLRNNMYSHNVW